MPYRNANGIDLYYEVHGHGPAMLLVHGLGADAREWEPLIEGLRESFTLISYDMRGSGRSEKPEGPYAMKTMADDAASLLEGIVQPPAGILGFSMGGCVALQLALDRPELVKSLTLVSTLPSWSGPSSPCERLNALFHRTDICDELLVELYETIFGSRYRKVVPPGEYVNERMNDEFPQPVEAYLAQLAALESFDVRDRVHSISTDTLVVCGTEDRVVPPDNSRWLADEIREARLEIIEGAGHMIPLEKPGELATLVAGSR